MTARDLLVSLLAGAVAALAGWAFLSLPAKSQERWRPALLAVCGLAIAIGIVIMIIGFLGGFDS